MVCEGVGTINRGGDTRFITREREWKQEMQREDVLCREHNKQFEMFCFEPGCRGEEVPMCSICMCEHVKQHHVNGAKHVVTVVNDRLAEVERQIGMSGKHQERIQTHHARAEDYLKTKDTVTAKLEDRLNQLLTLYTKQKELASDRNGAILKCNEKVQKAMKTCEHKIKDQLSDPQRVERKAKAMMQEHKYWLAYLEVQRALKETAQLDDREVQEELEKWKQLNTELQDQLTAIDLPPAQIAEYKQVRERNVELAETINTLTADKQQLTGTSLT